MKVGIFGSWDWESYPEIMRQMTLFIQESHEIGHSEILFVHTGSKGAENMITEYIGKTEKFLRQKGYKIKEELVRDKSSFSDVTMIESEPGIALIFGDNQRNRSCMKILDTFGIPYRYFPK